MTERNMAFCAGLAALAWLPGLAGAQILNDAALAIAISQKSAKQAPAIGGGARYDLVGFDDGLIRLGGEVAAGGRPTRSGAAVDYAGQAQFGIAPAWHFGGAWPHIGAAFQGDFDGAGAGADRRSARVFMAAVEGGKAAFFDSEALVLNGHAGVAHAHGAWGGDGPAHARSFGEWAPAVGGSAIAQWGRHKDAGKVTLRGSATKLIGTGLRSDATVEVGLSKRFQARGGIRQTSLTGPAGQAVNVVQPFVQGVWGVFDRGR